MVEERKERNKQEKLRKRRNNVKQCGKYCTKCKTWEHQKKECRVVKETETREGKL